MDNGIGDTSMNNLNTGSIKLYRMRWVVLFVFSFLTLTNAILWITFSPIATKIMSYYDIDSTLVNMLSLVFLFLYIPGSVLSNFIVSHYGVRVNLVLAAFLGAIGSWLRYGSSMGNPSYTLLLIGQIIVGLAQPLITNCPAKISSAWFPPSERDIATTIGSLMNAVGIAVGTIIPSVFVSGSGAEVTGVDSLLLFEGAFASFWFLTSFLIKDSPPTPPSAAQVDSSLILNSASSSFASTVRDIKECFSNKHFTFLALSFGVGLGLFNAVTTLLEQMVAPFCYTSDDASLFGGLLIGCGLVSAGFVGLFLEKTRKYKIALRLGFSGAALATMGFTLSLKQGSSDAIAATCALMGICMLPMLPASFEAAAEVTYPVSEDISTGILMSFGQLTGIGFIFGLDALIKKQPACGTSQSATFYYSGTSILLVCVIAVCCMLIYQFDGELKRQKKEAQTSLTAFNA